MWGLWESIRGTYPGFLWTFQPYFRVSCGTFQLCSMELSHICLADMNNYEYLGCLIRLAP
jgi:hypothetical protein